MAYEIEKSTGDIVITGFEQGISPSPHKGISNIQNANLSTEMGEVISSFVRAQDTMTSTSTTGSLSYLSTDHVNLSITGSDNLFKGNWVNVTASSNTAQLPNGKYFVPPSIGAGFELQNYYNVSATINPVTVSTLLVAGGGAAGSTSGSNYGGGGGAGGLLTGTPTVSNLTPYAITVGTGGAGHSGAAGSNGTDSAAFGLDAVGGGGGAFSAANGLAGGSGGGAGTNSSVTGTGGAGTTGQGHNGGNSNTNGGGGGGGAGAVGAAGATGGANGGVGISSSISGTATFYAGGGAGVGSGGAGTAGSGSIGQGGSAALASIGANGANGTVIISAPMGAITSATGGVHTTSGGNDIWTFTSSGTWTPTIPQTSAPTNQLTGFTTGLTATIQLVAIMGKPLASATETYYRSGIVYYRYYILDNQNLVWMYDSYNETIYTSTDGVAWVLPDYQTSWGLSVSGIGVISGFLIAASATGLYAKPTSLLGGTNTQNTNWMGFPDSNRWEGSSQNTGIIHYCFVGHQGNLYVTDGAYIANVFPDSTLADPASTADNVQSSGSWTTPSSAFQGAYSIISGTTPSSSDNKRVPVVFFTPGTLPISIQPNTIYYMQGLGDNLDFQVFSASTGGAALDIQTGAVGTQYFNTFYPIASATASTGSTPTYVFTPQRVALPVFEVAQCMAEIGNLIVIGCLSSTIYPWNQIDNLPSGIISLPESNVPTIISVNQMAYILAGNKGNIYITDGSVASLVTTVPDYCAGVPGTPLSYIEPIFSWGAAMYLRGRVFFSILDQTAIKAGNCGGIWSFVPTQNFYVGQDVGISLRLENQSSYGTYNGYSSVLIPKQVQNAIAPQYFSGWESSISGPSYGIDATGTVPTTTTIIESDIIPTGTMLTKQTFEEIEYKLASPLLTTDSVTIFYRKDLTSAWQSCGTAKVENNRISGYFSANFEKTQYLQLRTLLNSAGSFIRLTELRIR